MKRDSLFYLLLLLATGTGFSGCTGEKGATPQRVLERARDERRAGYSLPENIISIAHDYVLKHRGWARDIYSMRYLGHRGERVCVYIHHRDEDIGKDPTRLGSRYDFFVWVDEKTCEIKGEGALQ